MVNYGLKKEDNGDWLILATVRVCGYDPQESVFFNFGKVSDQTAYTYWNLFQMRVC